MQINAVHRAKPLPEPPVGGAVERTVYRITHDLSASVRALSQLSEWIVEDMSDAGMSLPESASDNLELLQERAKRLQTLMKDLTVYDQVGQGNTLFDGVWDPLIKSVLQRVPGTVDFSILTSLAAVPRIGLEDLRHVLSALISNAVKHHDHPKGEILIACQHEGNGFIRLSVQDDGPGIPNERRTEVCQAMTALQPRDVIEGSGMGLAICTKIAEAYGGKLSIRSPENGRGSCLTVTFANQYRAVI